MTAQYFSLLQSGILFSFQDILNSAKTVVIYVLDQIQAILHLTYINGINFFFAQLGKIFIMLDVFENTDYVIALRYDCKGALPSKQKIEYGYKDRKEIVIPSPTRM